MWSLRPASAACIVVGTGLFATPAIALTPPTSETEGIQYGAEVRGMRFEQVRPAEGEFAFARWARSADTWVRLTDTAITSGEREVCTLRLEHHGAPAGRAPLLEWIAPGEAGSPCTGIAPSGTHHLENVGGEGVHRLDLVAYDQRENPTGPGTLLARVDLGIDDSPPRISWPDVPDVVPGGTAVRVIPTLEDASGVWYVGCSVYDDLGRPVQVSAEGTAVVPPGRTLIALVEAGDGVPIPGTNHRGNMAYGSKSVRGLPLPATAPSPLRGGTSARRPATCPGRPLGAARFSVRTRRLDLSGCRTTATVARVQVRVQRRGRTVTRSYRLASSSGDWSRRIAVRRGETPVRVRVGTPVAWGRWARVARRP